MSAERLVSATPPPAIRSRLSEPSGIALVKSVTQTSQLIRTFLSLVGSQLGSAVLGLVFWALAARMLSPEQVGIGAALVAAMTLLSLFGVLGVGTLLLERFKGAPVTDRRALFGTGLSVAGVGGSLVAAGWLGVSRLVSVPGALGTVSMGSAMLLVGASGVAATCSAFDQAVIGMAASGAQLRRNLIASVLRIIILLGAIELNFKSGATILVSWTLALVGSVIATPMRRVLGPRCRVPVRHRVALIRNHWSVALGHHGLTLAMISSNLILPVVVAWLLSPAEMAYFAPARLLADSALMVPYFLTVALFAAVENENDFRIKARRTLALGMAMAPALLTGGAVFGHLFLLAFGSTYSRSSAPILMLLLAASPILVIKDHFVALRRLQRLRRQGAVALAVWTSAELFGAVLGGILGGVQVLCIGWLAMSAMCALVALPVVLRAIKVKTGAEEVMRPRIRGQLHRWRAVQGEHQRPVS